MESVERINWLKTIPYRYRPSESGSETTTSYYTIKSIHTDMELTDVVSGSFSNSRARPAYSSFEVTTHALMQVQGSVGTPKGGPAH